VALKIGQSILEGLSVLPRPEHVELEALVVLGAEERAKYAKNKQE
jgi:hypothetical protein